MVSQPKLSALEKSLLHDSQMCVVSQVCSYGWENRNLVLKTSPLGPVEAVPFHGHSHGAGNRQTYIHLAFIGYYLFLKS